MSTIVKAVLATTVISTTTLPAATVRAEPYCCPQPAICEALCASPCCEKKLVSSLLIPVLPETAATY